MTVQATARAKLIPMNGDHVETDTSRHIEVQFNPSTLRVTLSNTLNTQNRAGSGGGGAHAQYVDRSESSLSVELLFDTTVGHRSTQPNTDVRTLTRRIADAFMKPVENGTNRPGAPVKCRFQWGAFQFDGLMSNYGETLDFFAPEGIPLRATLALGFKEDKFQFEQVQDVRADPRPVPRYAPGGMPVDKATQAAGGNPKEWRKLADQNDLENPRFTPIAGLRIPISIGRKN
jgi:hypothetical protein